MKQRPRSMIAGSVLLAAALIFHACGGGLAAVGVPLAVIAAFVLFLASHIRNRPRHTAQNREEQSDADVPQSRAIEKEVNQETAQISVHVLGAKYRKEQWAAIESVIDTILDTALAVLRRILDANTIAVLFPTADGGYKMRRYDSKSDCINADAVIYPGVGVLGSFLKDGLKQLKLNEIVSDSMTLYYYTRDAGIRSLIASPIAADDNVTRGTVIADSIEPKHFSDEDHTALSMVARLIGLSVYYAYVYNEHRLEHQRIAAMSTIEKHFFQNLDIDAILDKMIEIIPFAISCDRITISLAGPDKTQASIVRAWGLEADQFRGMTFSPGDKSLIGLLFSKNMSFLRNYSEDRNETRYRADEPSSGELQSFLAFPIGVDECKGGVLCESVHKDAFSQSNHDLLARIATSAGLAIEKLQIFEQAQTLATHDGLTGLLNHREFQVVLKDEITRAIRYNDPLSLVIGDIDYFKKINDAHGHQFGDTVLKEIASTLKENIRDGVDIAARYGGEEFALILVKTDGVNAVETCERIRQNIENAVHKATHGADLRVTMSFGIAVYGQHAKQLDTLISKADKALYRAKGNGRNRVEIF
jgi:two-component system, cell cycle response regulator